MMQNFAAFKLSDLFEISSPRKRFNACAVTFGGKHPYVVRSSLNNGIRGYINEDEKYLNPGKTLSYGQDTATIFYQPVPYFTGDKIKVMALKEHELDEKIALYFVTLIRKAFSNFTWGQNSFNEEVLKSTVIVLPVVGASHAGRKYTPNDVDYKYMQEHISELENRHIAELEKERETVANAYLAASGLNDCKLTEDDEKVLALRPRFKGFKASDLFEIVKGKRLTQQQMRPGSINFIGSSSANNGVTAKIGNNHKQFLHPAGTITVSYNGSVGEAFLQDELFWASDDVNVWYPKAEYCKKVLIYMITVIRKCGRKYSFAKKWLLDEMRNEELLLPVTKDGRLDVDYMKRFIRAVEKKAVANLIAQKDLQFSKTMQAINS